MLIYNFCLAQCFVKQIIKVWSTFEKVVGVGKAHKYFPTFFRDEGFVLRVLLE